MLCEYAPENQKKKGFVNIFLMSLDCLERKKINGEKNWKKDILFIFYAISSVEDTMTQLF